MEVFLTIVILLVLYLQGVNMATVADMNASLDGLAAEVNRVAQEVADLKASQGGVPEADLDPVKARIDAAKDALAGL